MKYFTRERYQAFQNFDDAAMDVADADWEDTIDRYEAYVQTIRPDMPESVRQLEESFYFHDARVLSMGRRDDTFVISLHEEIEQVGTGDRKHFVCSILFSNGWEITLAFRDVQVSLAEPVYPLPGMAFVPTTTPSAAPSA
jgi:hypothetical protein